MNKGELKAEVLALSHRADLATRVDAFIARAETMIANRVRSLELVASGTLLDAQRVSVGGAVYNMPANFLGFPKRGGIVIGTDAPVTCIGLTQLRGYASSVPPAFAAVYGRLLEFAGAPAIGATIALSYFARPVALVADGDTNTLLTNCELLYIHAALHWVHLDGQDIDMSSSHKDLFEDEADRLNRKAERAMAAGVVSPHVNFSNRGAM